jgi:hypothetical protein
LHPSPKASTQSGVLPVHVEGLELAVGLALVGVYVGFGVNVGFKLFVGEYVGQGLVVGLGLFVGLRVKLVGFHVGQNVGDSVGLSSKLSQSKSAGGETLLLQVTSLIQS